jgi:polar amino acid transport system substrate-binding protein
MKEYKMSAVSRARRIGALVGVGALLVSLAACSAASEDSASATVTAGKITIATGEPAYYPYVLDDAPDSGEGFESAIAYAVAEELGFAAEDVIWVRTTFEAAIQPGPKNFDFNLQQYTITEERAQNVDFSTPYYSTPQAIITVESSPAAGATTVAELEGFLIGAASGTTSFEAIEASINPSAGAQAFNNNDDAKLALETGQIDALVVDLPTAFYLTGVELTGGIIIGQLPSAAGFSDEWGFVLAKDSELTASVNEALARLRDSGRLKEITDQWLGSDQGAPLLK